MLHPQTYKKLARARDFMRDAYREPISLSEISAEANLSRHHFLRAFKHTYQETPHSYLTRLRLERAKVLLGTGRGSVLEVCQEVGFESPSTFSTLFARHVGVTPSDYRRLARSSILVPSPYRTLFIPSCFLGWSGGLA